MKKLIEHQKISKRRDRYYPPFKSKKSMLNSAEQILSLQSTKGRSIAESIDYIIGESPSLDKSYRPLQTTKKYISLTKTRRFRHISPFHLVSRALRSLSQISIVPVDLSFICAIILALLPIGAMLTPSGNIVTHTFQSAFFTLPLSSEVIVDLNVAQEAELSAIKPEEAEGDFSKVSYTEFILSRGDTLSDLAQRYNITVSTLASFNKIDNARSLQAGRRYRIPDREGLLHVVKNGESLEQIVAKYDADMNAILDTNDLPNTAIVPGLELFIPGAALSDWELRLISGELFSYPVSGRLTSRFGYRNDPFTGIRRFHYGIDLAAPTGRSVRAAMEGRVSYIGNQAGGYGKYVILKHPGGFQSLYAHLNGFNVSSGQSVARGQVIGWVGNTGRSTGAHLHFSIIKNGRFQNPYNYLN